MPSAPTLTSPDGGADPPVVCGLLRGFRSAARLGRSAVGGTIFAQFGELAAGAVGFRRLLSQLGVVVLCLFLFPSLFCCLRGAIQTSESSRIDFQRCLKLLLRFLRPIQFSSKSPSCSRAGTSAPGETGCLPRISSASAARRNIVTASSFLFSPYATQADAACICWSSCLLK